MKRKASNNINLHTKKRLKEREDNLTTYNEAVCKRRKEELLEIVSKENEIYRPHKLQDADQLSSVVSEDCSTSSDNSTDCDNEDEDNLRLFRIKERQKVIEDCRIISKTKAKTALCILEGTIKGSKDKLTNAKKRLNMLEKYCSKRIHGQEEREITWDSSMYIIKVLRTCILKNDWKNVTSLLLMLLKYKKKYVSYVKQVALLNVMKNPLDYNGEILEELHKLCGVSASN